ncbi:MAG: hypothetical protein ACLFUU_10870 [Desulfobacteraceae bacterium]
MADNSRPAPEALTQAAEDELLERIRSVADWHWKINRCLKILETTALQLEDPPPPPIDCQTLAEALDWLTTLFQQHDRRSRFAHRLIRLNIELRQLEHEQSQLQLRWRNLAGHLRPLPRTSLQALYDTVPELKAEVDRVSSRLRALPEIHPDFDSALPPAESDK